MPNYYDDIFKLCGFEDEEIDEERPRIERTLGKVGIGPQDAESAERWIKKNHDVELAGVRKILGIWLKELIDLVLAKDEGKRVLYYGFPTITGPAGTIAAASDEVLCVCPDAVLCYTMGQIFNKIQPIMKAGEENGLPPGHALCSLQQVRVGALARGIIPVPDLVLTSSYFCDMGSKTDELLHFKYGHPAVYIDGSMDSRWGEFPNYLPERAWYLGEQLEKGFEKARLILGIEITEEARIEGATRMRDIFKELSGLVKLMKNADPQPISVVDVELARRLTIGSASRRIIRDSPPIIRLLSQELKERINNKVGIMEPGAPRVMTYLSHMSDPSIPHMIEGSGISIPLTFAGALSSARFRKTISFISGQKLAEVELARGTFYGNYGIIQRAAEAAEDAKVDGILWDYLFNCKPLGQPAYLLKKFVEQKLRIPVLALESDLADNRTYSAAALKTKVETFAEMLRARRS